MICLVSEIQKITSPLIFGIRLDNRLAKKIHSTGFEYG